MSVGEFLLVVASFLAALLALPAAWNVISKRWLERRARDVIFPIDKVRDFDPAWVVTGYGVGGFREYWPTSADAALDEAFARRENVLIIGRPHVGKSRAAIHHLKKHFCKRWSFSRWRILRPMPNALDELAKIRIPRSRYILLLDDLDIYIRKGEPEGVGILQLIQILQRQSRELMVVATLRRTRPEFEALRDSPHLLGRWRSIELPDWRYEDGLKLAMRLEAPIATWDGTPLSVIQPSPLMAERYHQAPVEEKKALRTLKLCFENGLFFVPTALFFELCRTDASGIEPSNVVTEAVVNALYDKGWLVKPSHIIQSFPALVPIIDDWTVTSQTRTTLMDVLVTGRWHRQLAACGGACVRTGDFSVARQAYEAAIAIEPTNEGYHYRLGILFGMVDERTLAIASFERATQIKPRWATAWCPDPILVPTRTYSFAAQSYLI